MSENGRKERSFECQSERYLGFAQIGIDAETRLSR